MYCVQRFGVCVLFSCFYVQDVLELVTRKEEGRARDGGMEREMSHFLCQTVVFH